MWKPMHLQPTYADRPNVVNGSSEQLFSIGLTLPSASALTGSEMNLISDTIRGFLDDRAT